MSFASRLEGLLQQVGLSGVVEEVRSRLGYTRPQPPPSRNGATHAAPHPVARKETPAAAPTPAPPGVAEPTRVERTPRPRPVAEAEAEPLPIEASAPEAPAARAPKAKKARTVAKVPKAKKASSTKAASAKSSSKSAARSKPREKKPEAPAADSNQAVGQLVEALRAHPRHEELRAAGKLKDQLVRSLIPLYLARAMELDMEVTSGTTSRFWGELGVTYAAPNAAKALRLHAGYAQDTKKGKAITPKGVQYVEETLKKQREGASA
ncbi:hypothetical protein [Myxococcus landrumensis]|uniref:Uncharacterized protein n=1 Tax=Myxococcus landrumensis TaxID=2813577 RepID=A0ABX7N4E1_9BACT|nr:hypothetical protein [Myxococcus landrumus]QSQ13503.1 hypothetical protein JY572_35045 [Myxococcus landrumus]